jgi:hypothetical protein
MAPGLSSIQPKFLRTGAPASEEIFRVKEPSEFDDHLQQRRERLSPRFVARWGIRNGLSLRGIPGRMNEDSEIG